MSSGITNIYNKKTKGSTLMVFFTATGKLEMFDVCTTGDTAHIDTIFKFLPHTRQHADACAASFLVAVKNSIKVGPLIFLL
jgi:hypothetical protein